MGTDDKLKEIIRKHTVAMEERNEEYLKFLQNMETRDKQFDKLLELNTEAERRRIAGQALQGILSNDTMLNTIVEGIVECGEELTVDSFQTSVAQCAVGYTDALIAELNKKKES